MKFKNDRKQVFIVAVVGADILLEGVMLSNNAKNCTAEPISSTQPLLCVNTQLSGHGLLTPYLLASCVETDVWVAFW